MNSEKPDGGATPSGFFYAISKLVDHTDGNDIIIVDAQLIIAIELVDFIIDKRGHIFVELVRCAEINIIHQIFIADAFNIFPFRQHITQ